MTDVVKIATVLPVTQEMLDDAPPDIWTATIQPPSPLERAHADVEEARARLEEAQERFWAASDELEAQSVTPGSHVRPPPFKMAEALRDAVERRLPRG